MPAANWVWLPACCSAGPCRESGGHAQQTSIFHAVYLFCSRPRTDEGAKRVYVGTARLYILEWLRQCSLFHPFREILSPVFANHIAENVDPTRSKYHKLPLCIGGRRTGVHVCTAQISAIFET